jgi:hypothetical protein
MGFKYENNLTNPFRSSGVLPCLHSRHIGIASMNPKNLSLHRDLIVIDCLRAFDITLRRSKEFGAAPKHSEAQILIKGMQ